MTGSSPLSHSALLSALLAALSHELGSPLAAIKGAATTLIDYRQRLPDDRIAGFLHSIDQQTDHLNALLDDLVLLAKIEAGTLRLQPEPIALRTVIEQAIDQLPPDQRDACLIEGSDPQVMADAPYLRQALVLLLQHLRDEFKHPNHAFDLKRRPRLKCGSAARSIPNCMIRSRTLINCSLRRTPAGADRR